MQNLPVKPSVLVALEPGRARDEVLLVVTFAHFGEGEAISLSIMERDPGQGKDARTERVLGTIDGTLHFHGRLRLGLTPSTPAPAAPSKGPQLRVRFPSGARAHEHVFPLSKEKSDQGEGDTWLLSVRADSHDVESVRLPVARVRRQIEHGDGSYEWHAGHALKLYNDGCEDERGSAGALADMVAAIEHALHFVFVVGWSFQPLFRPLRTSGADPSQSIGALLLTKALSNPAIVVAVHAWKHVQLAVPDAANNQADDILASIAKGMGVKRPDNLLWRITPGAAMRWSHHQKFVVLDAPGASGRRELKVFWGGLDLTMGRLDWSEHVVSAHSPRAWPFRQRWNTLDDRFYADEWYNCEVDALQIEEPARLDARSKATRTSAPPLQVRGLTASERWALPRQPWHDVHGMLQGPAAWDFAREFVGRWCGKEESNRLQGASGDDAPEHRDRVWKAFEKLHQERDTFVQQYEPHTGKWCAQVYRSLDQQFWQAHEHSKEALLRAMFNWTPKGRAEQSIQHAYLHTIRQAERFIYIENQYLVGSGARWGKETIANDVPMALVRRIQERRAENAPFHVYIVMPMFPEGDPVSDANREVRLNEWNTLTTMIRELGPSWKKYLSVYFLANWETKSKVAMPEEVSVNPALSRERQPGRIRMELLKHNQRYMVYVHSKLMIIDDRYALFGSCNLNERGLAGDRDSEIACGIWPSHGHGEVSEVRDLRKRLWREHFGSHPVAQSDAPELVAAEADHLADTNFQNLFTMAAPPVGYACRWPFMLTRGRDAIKVRGPEYLPDSPARKKNWNWRCDGNWLVRLTELAD